MNVVDGSIGVPILSSFIPLDRVTSATFKGGALLISSVVLQEKRKRKVKVEVKVKKRGKARKDFLGVVKTD
jgi:hypothetical protein